jgi:hypothetical protein
MAYVPNACLFDIQARHWKSEYIDWLNHRRLDSACDYRRLAEHEAAYYAQRSTPVRPRRSAMIRVSKITGAVQFHVAAFGGHFPVDAAPRHRQ